MNGGPLTVDSGHVDCESGALVFRHDGTIYALNMTALGRGYPGIDPIYLEERGQSIESSPIKGGPDAIDRFGSTAVQVNCFTNSCIAGHKGSR